MYDDDKSVNVHLICNEHEATYNKFLGMNPMGLSDPWHDFKNKQSFTNIKCNKQPYDVTQTICKVLTQWALVPLGTTIKQTIIHKNENVTNNFII